MNEKTSGTTKKETKTTQEKVNIRCRVCFIVDGYTKNEKKCKHCHADLFLIDRY